MMRPEDIKSRKFGNALRGYDKNEVRSFLLKVAESSKELHDQLTTTEQELAAVSRAGSQEASDTAPVPDALVEASTDAADAQTASTDLASAEQSIADRYGALGDRIADLLRNADDSAGAIIASAESESEATRAAATEEAARIRTESEEHAAELLAEARAIRVEVDAYREEVTSELETTRSDQETALAEAKATAEAEVEKFRLDSINEVEELRSNAAREVELLRAAAHEEVNALRESAIADGEAAIAEHEAEAARLRQEAETDRSMARSELDDVRSEVSNLLEQARTQSEFIKQEADEIIRTKVRANFEQAQARIDVLRNTEVASRERIVRAQTELTSALDRLDAEPAPALDPGEATPVIEEAERRQSELVASSPWDAADGPATEVDTAVQREEGEPGWGGQDVFEADVAEANELIDSESDEQSSLSAFFGPGADDSSEGPVDGADAPRSSEFDVERSDAGFVESDIIEGSTIDEADDSVDAALSQTGTDDDAVESDEFEVTEHVVVESVADDSPMRGEGAETPAEDSTDPGPATLGDPLPPEAPELGGRAEEDALARLVREAMQEAVDSARKHD